MSPVLRGVARRLFVCGLAGMLSVLAVACASSQTAPRNSTPRARSAQTSASQRRAAIGAYLTAMRGPTVTTARSAMAAANVVARLEPGSTRPREELAVAALGAAGHAFDRYAVADGGGQVAGVDRGRVRSARLAANALRVVADGLRRHAPRRMRAGHALLDAATRTAVAWQGQVRRLATRWRLSAPDWTAQLSRSQQRLLHVIQVIVSPGPPSTGPQITVLQHRLATLGYLPAGYATGTYDYRTLQAVMAFQGWEGLVRDGIAGPITQRRLAEARRPTPWSTAGKHIEIHISRQVLLLVSGGRVVRAIHVATAAPGHVTPIGRFAIYRKERMSWSVPFQVWLPYASYFTGGYAIHEYPDVPPYPASHGCVRVPAGDSSIVWDFATIGTLVVVG